jgi:hypothetical protein
MQFVAHAPQDPPGAGPFPAVHTSHFPEPEIEQLAQFPAQDAQLAGEPITGPNTGSPDMHTLH